MGVRSLFGFFFCIQYEEWTAVTLTDVPLVFNHIMGLRCGVNVQLHDSCFETEVDYYDVFLTSNLGNLNP